MADRVSLSGPSNHPPPPPQKNGSHPMGPSTGPRSTQVGAPRCRAVCGALDSSTAVPGRCIGVIDGFHGPCAGTGEHCIAAHQNLPQSPVQPDWHRQGSGSADRGRRACLLHADMHAPPLSMGGHVRRNRIRFCSSAASAGTSVIGAPVSCHNGRFRHTELRGRCHVRKTQGLHQL